MTETPPAVDYHPGAAVSVVLDYARRAVASWIHAEHDAWRAGRVPEDSPYYKSAHEKVTLTKQIALRTLMRELTTQFPNLANVDSNAKSIIDTYCDYEGQWEMQNRPGSRPDSGDLTLEELEQNAAKRRLADAQIPRHTWARDHVDDRGRVELVWDTMTVGDSPAPAQLRVLACPKRRDRGETAPAKVELEITDADGRGTPIAMDGRSALELSAVLATASERLRDLNI
ncbi:MAG: hypothetical protein ACRD0P_03740 [Stackebrandtia sp.]